jgi:hypothetical protein
MGIPTQYYTQWENIVSVGMVMEQNDYPVALNSLTASSTSRSQAESDPKQFLISQGISESSLEGVDVSFTNNNWNLQLCVGSSCLKYDSNSGFSTRTSAS